MKNCNTILREKLQKYQHYHRVKHAFLAGEEILPSDQSRINEQAKFTYSSLGKAFEKETKAIEEQEEKQIKTLGGHGKELIKSCGAKESQTLLKQKESSKEIAYERIDEIQNLSKRTVLII